jgi:hypothetical protein
LLDALNPQFALAQQVAPTDDRLRTEYVEIAAPAYGKARGYAVQPAKSSGKLPVVLVVHENRGLNPTSTTIRRHATTRVRPRSRGNEQSRSSTSTCERLDDGRPQALRAAADL